MKSQKSMRQRIREVNFKFYKFLLWRDVKRKVAELGQAFEDFGNSAESASSSMKDLVEIMQGPDDRGN